MELKKLLLIVDGPTEQGAIKAKFHKEFQDCPEIRNGPGNGINFTSDGYAKGVIGTVKFALSSKIHAIILLPDHEKRKCTCSHFASELKKKIIDELTGSSKYKKEYLEEIIHVCPPNIMFENWIISDVEGIKDNTSLIDSNSIQQIFDGKNGASELNKMMKVKYKKTVHAQILFKHVRDSVSELNSASYKRFIACFKHMLDTHCK